MLTVFNLLSLYILLCFFCLMIRPTHKSTTPGPPVPYTTLFRPILHAPEGSPREATVAERGQITLPKAVRDVLGRSKGTILKVELEGGRIILRKSVDDRSEEHTSELQSLMRLSYAVFCLKKKILIESRLHAESYR